MDRRGNGRGSGGFDLQMVLSRNELHYSNRFISRDPCKHKEKLELQLRNWARRLNLRLMPFGVAYKNNIAGKDGPDDCALATKAAISYCLQSRNDPEMIRTI